MDATPKTDLIDLLRGFHDIFMYDYSVEGNVLSIQTKLPQLWKEASKTLNSYATGQITYDEAKDSLLNKIIRGQVYSMSTIPILVAARDMGLELNQFLWMERSTSIQPEVHHNGIDITASEWEDILV